MPTDLKALFARKRKARWEKNKESQAVLWSSSASSYLCWCLLTRATPKQWENWWIWKNWWIFS